jgi:tetratricopeptide (TPR) repeat protein
LQRRSVRPKQEEAWKRLVAAARSADPNPQRDQLRDLWSRPDRKAQLGSLRGLAKEADPKTWPVQSLLLLAGALVDAADHDAAVRLLRRAHARHPDDVWTSYDLGVLLERVHPPRTEEAIRFYTAARAVRPETAHELAHALEGKGETDEAIEVFRDLCRLRPDNGLHLACLGRALKAQGRTREATEVLDDAVAALRAAIRLKASPRGTSLGNAGSVRTRRCGSSR